MQGHGIVMNVRNGVIGQQWGGPTIVNSANNVPTVDLPGIESRLADAIQRQRSQVEAAQSALHQLTGTTYLPPESTAKTSAPEGSLRRLDRMLEHLASSQGDMATLIGRLQDIAGVNQMAGPKAGG